MFEAGFSEKHGDLLGDMRQWLLKTDDVQLVIVIGIEENQINKKSRWETEACKARAKHLLRQFGNEKSRTKHAPEDSSDDIESGDHIYKQIRATIQVEDWVGEIESSIELWERGAQGLKERGPTMVSLHA